MRRLDLKFLILLIAVTASLGAGALIIYKVQRKRSVDALLVGARAAEKAGDHGKAEGLYAHYLGLRPDDPATMADYGLLMAREAGTPQARMNALPVLAQAVRLAPGRADIRREIVRIAMDRTVRGYPVALEQLEWLLAASPDDGPLEFQIGSCLEAEGKYLEAAAMYAKATAHDPRRVDAHLRLAGLLKDRLGKPAEADKVLDEMVAADPGSFRPYLERASRRRLGGLGKEAEGDIARALELAPDEVDALAMAGELAIDKGDVEQARLLADRCLKSRGDEGRFYDLSSRIEMRAGRPEGAEAILRKGIEVVPDAEDRIRLLMTLANSQVVRGDLPEAERTIARLSREDIRPVYPKFFEAQVLAGKGRWREAAKILDEIHVELINTPQMACDADLVLARCCERLGESDRRYAAIERAASLGKLSPQDRMGLADALAAAGRVDEAISRYRNLSVDIPRARAELARLLILQNLQRPPAERAWPEIDRALADAESASAGTMEVQLLRAEVLAERGRFDEAEEQLREAAGRFPGRDDPSIALADLALREGRRQVASEVLDRADGELGDRIGLRLARANVWVARGGPQAVEALGRLGEGLDRFPEPERTVLLRGLATAARRLADLPGARRIVDRLAERSPDDLTLRLARFDLAFRSGDAEGMRSIIESIGGNDEVDARLARARYLAWLASREDKSGEASRARIDEARQILGQLASRRPGWSPVVLASAYVDELGGDPDRAIRGYLQAIGLGERAPDVGIRVVGLLAGRGRYDQADEVVRKFLGGDAAMPSSFYRLAAEVALRRRAPARALDYAAKAVPPGEAKPVDRLWRGRLLWAAGKPTEAEPDLRSAADTAGELEAPDAWTTLVAYLASTGRRPAAEEATEHARRKLPERARPLALAQIYAILGRPQQAQEQYRAAVSSSPQDVATLESASNIALTIGNLGDAKDYLRKLVARQADSPSAAAEARRALGVLLAGSGDRRQVKEALTVMGLVEDRLPYQPASDESIEDLRAKAKVLSLRGGRQNRQAALQALRTVTAGDKPSPDDRFLLAQVLEMDGDWPKSREQIQLALADSGKEPAMLAFYIRGLLRHEEARGARPWLESLEKVDPSSLQTVELKARLALAEKSPEVASRLLGDFAGAKPDTAVRVALLLQSLGRLDDAERLFREFASRDKQPEAALPLAVFLGRRKRVPEALDLCDAAWKAGRPELVSQASVAVLYASMAGEEACRRVSARLEDAIRRSPEKVQLQFDLANVQILRGNFQDAEAVFRRIYEKDRENSASANNLAWLLALQDGKAGEAIALVDRAIGVSGPLPTLLDTRGVARVAAGLNDAAIEDLEEATNSGPTAQRYVHLALAYSKANRTKEAREALGEANGLGLDEGSLHPSDRKEYGRLLGELQGR